MLQKGPGVCPWGLDFGFHPGPGTLGKALSRREPPPPLGALLGPQWVRQAS